LRSQIFDDDLNEDDLDEPKVRLPNECYKFDYIRRPSVACCNGVIVIFDFSSFITANQSLPFYFVEPETGNVKILYAFPPQYIDVSFGFIMPLSRRDMKRALKEYPENNES